MQIKAMPQKASIARLRSSVIKQLNNNVRILIIPLTIVETIPLLCSKIVFKKMDPAQSMHLACLREVFFKGILDRIEISG